MTEDKLGRINVVEQKIALERDNKPFFVPNHCLPLSQRDLADKMIEEMKKDVVVAPSTSCNLPLLLVPEEDGTFHLVVDYSKLNAQTNPDWTPNLFVTRPFYESCLNWVVDPAPSASRQPF